MIAADVIDVATKAGTLPISGVLFLGLIMLGIVVKYLHGDNKKMAINFHQENKELQQQWMTRIEAERASMSQERIARINQLMQQMKDDTEVKARLFNAIDNNTKAISDLRGFVKEETQAMVEVIRETRNGR